MCSKFLRVHMESSESLSLWLDLSDSKVLGPYRRCFGNRTSVLQWLVVITHLSW